MSSEIKRMLPIIMAGACMSFALVFAGGVSAKAAEKILPYEEQTEEYKKKHPYHTDADVIQNAFNEGKYDIVLENGKTYNFTKAIGIPGDKPVTIDATNATIICSGTDVFHNITWTEADYNSVKGLTIIGGTWKSADSSGLKSSAFKIIHGQNITFKDMDIQCTNAGSHSIELVACKNVRIENCIVTALGSSSGKEEQIQLDLASPATAGKFGEKGAPLNGATCQNVVITGCTVTGNRGIGINADVKTAVGKGKQDRGKYANKYHKNVEISNCTIIGNKAEGLMAYNVIGLNVHDNALIQSKASPKKNNYSSGIHVLNQGKGKSMTVTIKNNTVKGGKHAIFVGSNSAKIKKATVTGNKVSCKGKNEKVAVSGCKKSTVKKNK